MPEAIERVDATFDVTEFRHPYNPDMEVDKVFDIVPDPDLIHREFDYIAFTEPPFDEGDIFLKDYEDEEGEEILSLFAATDGSDVYNHLTNYKI
jgi:hypothetical protein